MFFLSFWYLLGLVAAGTAGIKADLLGLSRGRMGVAAVTETGGSPASCSHASPVFLK
jgi:hypothetical protein